ncbi:MAG: hypothetical protein JSR66_17855, partial [Proteobacteria bacterium]|nr:hypothetical protein [Pseudomonadota bacterium]
MQKALSRQQFTSSGTPALDLSVAQTDVWRAQRLSSGDSLYNIGGYVEVFGSLNRSALHAAILRALNEADSQLHNFLDTPDGPRQVRTSVSSVDIPHVDLRDHEDPLAAATAWMSADMERPFDLSSGPAYRFALLQIGPQRTLWFCAFHHLVTDLFGTSLFLSRTAGLYTSAIENSAPAPAELTPWSEVLEDEREYYASNRCERDRVYWREQLQNLPEAVTLSGRAPGWPGASVGSVGSVPRALVARLEALGAAAKASLPAVLFASVALYMSRMTGKRDLVLGMPVTGRTNARLRRSAGFVANVVPLRLDVELTKSFAELVEDTGKRIREAYRHQRYGSTAIRNDLGLTASQANAYGVVLNFVPNDAEFEFAGHTVRLNIFTHSRRVEDLYITFHARSDGSDVVLQLDGHAAHYDQRSIDRHRRNFLTLLQTAVDQPQIASRLLPLLDDATRARVLGHWAGQKSAVEPRTFVEMFE